VGKEILLKAMVQAIPSFYMSVFLLLKSLCLEINNLMKGFWWWHIKKDRKIPWMSWDKLGIPKNSGGMGFRDLNCFNKSLLAKQVWRMWTMPDSLVAQIMKAKYFPNCSILEAPLRTRPSFAWRGIRSSCALIREGLIWRIGNRNKIKIWEDRWLPKPTSFRIQTPPTMLDLKSTVNQLIDVEGYYLNYPSLEQLFSVEERTIIQSLPISTTNQDDKLIWRCTDNSTFTVKSAFHLQKEWDSTKKMECSNPKNHSKVWKALWKLQIPNVDKLFF
jgi:hypothetical protein